MPESLGGYPQEPEVTFHRGEFVVDDSSNDPCCAAYDRERRWLRNLAPRKHPRWCLYDDEHDGPCITEDDVDD